MKSRRLTIKAARKLCARIPPKELEGRDRPTALLFRVDEGRVVETKLITVHREVSGDLCIHGFTHYAILPKYL